MEIPEMAYNRKMTMQNAMHQPVLVEKTFDLLNISKNQTYLDLTAGYGGHAARALQIVGDQRKLILVDRDKTSIKHLERVFPAAMIIHSDYLAALKLLITNGTLVDAVLMDLGVSSIQLDTPERGFSFRFDAPLDMRMDTRQKLTAERIVNNYSKQEIADILYRYGEERRSRQIAEAIVEQRPITTTLELVNTIEKANRRQGRIHPATRSFQALRIAVNDELAQLESSLQLLPRVLKPGGRAVVISFHSLEDRIVKHYLKERAKDHSFTILTKKVIMARDNELSNRRARSAKLRAAIKNKN